MSLTLSASSPWSKSENPRFAVGIVVISAILSDISTSDLDDRIAISGCPSTSHLFVDTFFEYGVVENMFFVLELQ